MMFHGEFPDGPVVETRSSTAGGMGLILGQGTEIPTLPATGRKDKQEMLQCFSISLEIFIDVCNRKSLDPFLLGTKSI